MSTPPRKVLHVISSTDPAIGGPIEGLKQIAKALAPHGVTIEIASLDVPGSPWLKDMPVKVTPLGPGKGVFAYSPKMVPWLKRHGKDYDRIVVNGIWQWHGSAVWMTRRAHRRPYFVFVHGMLDPYFKKAFPLKHLKKQAFWLASQYQSLRDAASVVFTCEEERLLARNGFWPYGFAEKVIAYGTSAAPANLEDAKAAFLTAHPECADKRLVLFLSRLHPKKGCDLLIEAFAAIAAQDPSLHLVMAGPDKVGLRAELEKRTVELGIADRVSWPGMLTGDLKWGAYAAAEVFALPSHQENFGIVVAEALATATPVLISDKINIWREIEADCAGFVGDDTADGARKVLDRWLSLTPDERTEMGQRALACFSSRFEISRTAETYMDIVFAEGIQ